VSIEKSVKKRVLLALLYTKYVNTHRRRKKKISKKPLFGDSKNHKPLFGDSKNHIYYFKSEILEYGERWLQQ